MVGLAWDMAWKGLKKECNHFKFLFLCCPSSTTYLHVSSSTTYFSSSSFPASVRVKVLSLADMEKEYQLIKTKLQLLHKEPSLATQLCSECSRFSNLLLSLVPSHLIFGLFHGLVPSPLILGLLSGPTLWLCSWSPYSWPSLWPCFQVPLLLAYYPVPYSWLTLWHLPYTLLNWYP